MNNLEKLRSMLAGSKEDIAGAIDDVRKNMDTVALQYLVTHLQERSDMRPFSQELGNTSVPASFDAVLRSTYWENLERLRERSTRLHPLYSGKARPLTFKETVAAKVEQYYSSGITEQRTALFNKNLSTCTTLAYNWNVRRAKVCHMDQDILTTPFDWDDLVPQVDEDDALYWEYAMEDTDFVLPVPYDEAQGVEIPLTSAALMQPLIKQQVYENPVWRVLMEDDVVLHKEHVDICYNLYAQRYPGENTGCMGVHVPERIERAGLQAVFIANVDAGCSVNRDDFVRDLSFVRLMDKVFM